MIPLNVFVLILDGVELKVRSDPSGPTQSPMQSSNRSEMSIKNWSLSDLVSQAGVFLLSFCFSCSCLAWQLEEEVVT